MSTKVDVAEPADGVFSESVLPARACLSLADDCQFILDMLLIIKPRFNTRGSPASGPVRTRRALMSVTGCAALPRTTVRWWPSLRLGRLVLPSASTIHRRIVYYSPTRLVRNFDLIGGV